MIKKLIVIAVLFASPAFGQQPWSNILSTSRAINWQNAGLPATLPDSETTTNPWTPPTRTKCGSTISAGASASTINSALAACANGTYVLLGAGNFNIVNSQIVLFGINEVTLRGSGGNSTNVTLSGSSSIALGSASGAGAGTITQCNGASV